MVGGAAKAGGTSKNKNIATKESLLQKLCARFLMLDAFNHTPKSAGGNCKNVHFLAIKVSFKGVVKVSVLGFPPAGFHAGRSYASRRMSLSKTAGLIFFKLSSLASGSVSVEETRAR